MTDDQKPEDLGTPPVGGPLRPDQQPPGFPDPNAPRLEFGPGSPQRQTPPQNGSPQGQNGSPQGQNGPQQGAPSQQGPAQPSGPGHTGGMPRPQGGAPGQPSGPPASQAPAQSGTPFAGAPGGQPWSQQRPANAGPNQQPQQQQGRPGGPEGFRPPASNGQPGQAPGRPQQGQAFDRAPQGRPFGVQQGQPQGPQGQPPYGQARPTGSQPFGPGQAQHPNGPFQPGPQQHGSQPGQQQHGPQQTGPFRPGPEYGATGQQPAPNQKAARKPLGRKLWVGVLIGAVAASLIAVPLTLLSVGRLFTPMLDRAAVQTGVADVLKQDFGLADVEKVECPSDQPARTGTEFECTFSYNAKSYPVAVEVINDQGQYRVGIDAPK
jgi:hypothetical protein